MGPENFTILQHIEKYQEKHDLQGRTALSETKLFKMDFTELLCEANISANSMHLMKRRIENYKQDSLGNIRELSSFMTILRDRLGGENRTHFTEHCFPQFASCTDGTPCFASAEAVNIRSVTLDYWITERVVRVKLLDKSPNSDGLADLIEEVFLDDVGLHMRNWRAAMKDRAATNGAAIRKLKDKHHIKVFEADCNSHTLSHVGEKVRLPPSTAKHVPSHMHTILH